MTERHRTPEYVVCINNTGYRASLIVRRIYRTLRDPEVSKRGLLRVVDESGEDYLYPVDLFAAIELPRPVSKQFAEMA